jgi:Peptidase M15
MVIKITEPEDRIDIAVGEAITFQGTADSGIVMVELSADGRWPLGQCAVMGGKWSATYAFNRSGSRSIQAKGWDSDGKNTAIDAIWIFVNPAIFSPDMQLTPNFTLRELTASSTADRLGIDNTPNAQEIDNLRTLCEEILQPARDALGAIRVNSAFRSQALNSAVGGVPDSDHRLGFAADIMPASMTTSFGTRTLAEWIAENVLFDQVILEFGTINDPNWIHVSAAPRKRKQILRAFSSGGETVYESIRLA